MLGVAEECFGLWKRVIHQRCTAKIAHLAGIGELGVAARRHRRTRRICRGEGDAEVIAVRCLI
jgi:hypothetical protein